MTMAVLGPYNAADTVEVIYRTASGGTGSIQADFRRARDASYSVGVTRRTLAMPPTC